jgi:hypothetical protein
LNRQVLNLRISSDISISAVPCMSVRKLRLAQREAIASPDAFQAGMCKSTAIRSDFPTGPATQKEPVVRSKAAPSCALAVCPPGTLVGQEAAQLRPKASA